MSEFVCIMDKVMGLGGCFGLGLCVGSGRRFRWLLWLGFVVKVLGESGGGV